MSQETTQVANRDSLAAVGQLTETVDRIARIRSFGELWELIGAFQVEVIGFALKLVVALVVLAVFVGIYRLVAAGLRPVFQRSHLQADAAELMLAILKYGLLGFGVILALDQLGFNVMGLVAGLGIAGLALGFAAKDTLANFIAGITILWDRPFRVGDRVEIDGEFGQVKSITLRSTRIHTNENMVVIIPNNLVVNSKVINHTMQASLRLAVPFGIAYKDDIDQARTAVLALVEGDDHIRERPAPDVVLTELAESSVNFELRFWIKDPHTEVPLELEYREKIKRALDRAGIEIPFPHLSVFVEKLPGGEQKAPAGQEPSGDGAEGAGP